MLYYFGWPCRTAPICKTTHFTAPIRCMWQWNLYWIPLLFVPCNRKSLDVHTNGCIYEPTAALITWHHSFLCEDSKVHWSQNKSVKMASYGDITWAVWATPGTDVAGYLSAAPSHWVNVLHFYFLLHILFPFFTFFKLIFKNPTPDTSIHIRTSTYRHTQTVTTSHLARSACSHLHP